MDDERCGEGELKYNTGESYRGKWSDDKPSKPVTVCQAVSQSDIKSIVG